MNRILLSEDEIDAESRVELRGRRAAHIIGVLRAEPGRSVRIGVLNGPRGHANVLQAAEDSVLLECRLDEGVPPRWGLHLVLALPRPKVMKRLWAPLASFGVERITLTNAARVERNYFDTHWLQAAAYEPLLIEGAIQAGDTCIPSVGIQRRLKPFIEDELSALPDRVLRVVAEPGMDGRTALAELSAAEEVVLAVGPEGGWTRFELDLWATAGFAALRMGWRTLRSDVACLGLLGFLHGLRSVVVERM